MKKKEMTSLRAKTVEELRKIVSEKKKELSSIEIKIKMSQEKNLKAFNNLRKDVSKILTIINEKGIVEKVKKVVKIEKEAKPVKKTKVVKKEKAK